MKLYYLPGACPLASHIVLAWINKPFTAHRVSRTEIKESEFLALNPLGAVPVLVDGDFVLTQSSAILEYLAEQNPDMNLLGKSLQERAETRRWLAMVNADIHRNFGILFGIASYADQPECQGDVKEKTKAKLINLFKVVDKQLEGRTWLTGTRSIADPYLYTVLRWATSAKLDIAELNNLKQFMLHMQDDAGVKAALNEQGLS